jgi:cyclomaltodextrinase / maltogenic alpha-amylase / neopullulanase
MRQFDPDSTEMLDLSSLSPNDFVRRARSALVVGFASFVFTALGDCSSAALTPLAVTTGVVLPSDAVVYEIFPRVFSENGLQGITAALPVIQRLGINVIWLMPIQPTSLQHAPGQYSSPYGIRDYRAVNSDYGSDADLRSLVETAHGLGLLVILDLVANHTAWDNNLIAHHPNFYVHDSHGNIISPRPEWQDAAKLDYSNAQLRRYMSDTMAYWVKSFNIDGFRCDYAEGPPQDFWDDAVMSVRKIKGDLFLLAEGEVHTLTRTAFDADYAWYSRDVIEAVVKGKQPASSIATHWRANEARYPTPRLHLRFTDNHDQVRAVSALGRDAARAALALELTLDGVPLIYNGQEVDDTAESAGGALYERRPIQWPRDRLGTDTAQLIRAILSVRKDRVAFRRSSVQWIENSDGQHVVSFLRTEDAHAFLVLVNLSSTKTVVKTVLPSNLGTENSTTLVAWPNEAPSPRAQDLNDGVELGPWSVRILEVSVRR